MLMNSGCCICSSMHYEWSINLYIYVTYYITGGDCECLCTVVAAYAHQCTMSGVSIYLYMLHIILQEVTVSAYVQWLLHMPINVL